MEDPMLHNQFTGTPPSKINSAFNLHARVRLGSKQPDWLTYYPLGFSGNHIPSS